MNSESDYLLLRVSNIRNLTPRIRAYELRPAAGSELPLASAGSHIGIPVQLAGGKTAVRDYAICSNPLQRDFYEIAVLQTGSRRGGADYIFTSFDEGTRIECRNPVNNFYLHADASPAMLIAGGIGIAPIIAIAYTLLARGRRFELHYAGRSKNDMAFTEELQQRFGRQLHMYPADEAKRLDIMQLLADASGNTLFYACGPQAMLDDIETCARLLGIAKDRVQIERFAPGRPEHDKALILELAYTHKLIQVDADQSLLAAVRDVGINASFDCGIGDCGTCAVKILEGEAEHRDHVLSDSQKAQGFICLCVSRAKGGKLILAL